MSDSLEIIRIEFWPVDVPITDPFVVATGARLIAENILIRVTLMDGAQGYGEAAPFPEVGGEDRASCLCALRQLGLAVLHRSADCFTGVAQSMKEILRAGRRPVAAWRQRSDAYCHALNIPMWKLWGAADVQSGKRISPYRFAV